jgi:hypothetical protein
VNNVKKLLFLVMVLVTGFCFAQGEENEAKEENETKPESFDLEITIGVPVHWTNSPLNHRFYQTGAIDTDKVVTANTAIGVAMLFNNSNRKSGFAIDIDFFFGSDLMGQTRNDSYSNGLFGFNALMGPVIFLFNGDFLRVPLAIGAHIYYWSSDSWYSSQVGTNGAWMKTRDLQIGPGVYLGIQLHFNKDFYFLSRINVAVDLYRWHQIMSVDNLGVEVNRIELETAISWAVKPTIGIGIKF